MTKYYILINFLLLTSCVQQNGLNFKKVNPPPVILNSTPGKTAYLLPTNTIQLSVTTDREVRCSYSVNSKDSFEEMIEFQSTGSKVHQENVSVSEPGNYTYYVRCSDSKKIVSNVKTFSFNISDSKPEASSHQPELRSSVRKIFDSSCMSCHGAGKSFQKMADLAPNISDIEKDSKLVRPGDLKNSFLYQQITTGNMKSYIKDPKDAEIIKEWILSISTPITGVTTPPKITSSLPNGTTYEMGVSSVKLTVVTDKAASCGFSTSAVNLVYNQMTKFTVTGDKTHSHTANNLKVGKHSYFVKCIDAAKNESIYKEIEFSIKDAAISYVPTTAELKVSVRKIFDTNCLSCHGVGKRYQGVLDLSLNVEVIEKNAFLIKPKDYLNSELYKQVTTGGMSTYLSKPADVEVIKNWILSLSPATADTTAPVITNFLPNGTQYPTTVTSAKLDITTNKDASCSFSLSAGNLDYSKMTKFNTTGAKVHSHMINNLKPGSYSYFVKCMDVAKNVSLHKEINFIIKSLISAPMPTKDQLRASVRKILDTSCIRCHAPDKQYQSIIDLTIDLKVLEKNTKFIKVKDPDNSFFYQKVTSGSMAKYITVEAERRTIRDWISLVDGLDVITLKCAAGEEALDNICVKVGKTVRSYGYRMITPEELFKDINTIWGVNLVNKDPVSGQPIVPEPSMAHGFNNQNGLVSPNSVFISAIERVAIMLEKALNSKADFDPKTVSCMSDTYANCGMLIAKLYIPKVFRRTLSTEELEMYRGFFLSQKGTKKVVYINFFKALVQSPSFIFREEHGKNPNPMYNLDAYEVASRLSYFITGQGPDATLKAKADNGTILTKAVREAEAKRLMATLNSQNHLSGIFMESIGIGKLVHTEDLNKDMKEETSKIIKDIFFNDSKKWTDVFTTNYTYVNKRLAEIYKISTSADNNTFVKTNYPDNKRSGILSHASYLSAFYDGKSVIKTKDIRRGINFYERILCKSMPLPPADVDIDLDPANGLNGCRIDNRKASTSHPAATCYQCHQHFDPIGLGFERFNNRGEYREVQEDDKKCNTIEKFYLTGGQKFDIMADYTKSISENSRVGRCLALKMKSYAYGSEVDASFIDSIFLEMNKFKSSMNFKDLIIDIVSNDQFIKREIKDEK